MVYKISEIVKDLKESLPEETAEKYWQDIKAKNVNVLLEEENLLYRDGKFEHPTHVGIQKGIFEELRTKQDTGEEYYQILYTEEAKKSVIKILYSNFPEMDPAVPKAYDVTEYTAAADSDRNAARQIMDKYNCPIVFMKKEDDFSIYDEGIIHLCEILKPVHCFVDTVNSEVKITPCDLKRYVIPALIAERVSFAVNNMTLKVYKYLNCFLPQRHELPEKDRRIRIGDLVSVQTPKRNQSFYFAREYQATKISIWSNGTIDFSHYHESGSDGIRIVLPNEDYYNDLKRHKVGDELQLYYNTFLITGIRRGNEIESILPFKL